MVIYEFKIQAKAGQFQAIDEAIKISQFIRNKCLRLWMDERGTKTFELHRQSSVLAKEFEFAARLNSMARQAATERAAFAITRFYERCKLQKDGKLTGKVGYPQFQKDCRSVEYKTSGWKLSEDAKRITFTDGCGIGTLKMVGTRDLAETPRDTIKRVRLVKQADGVYVQFCIDATRKETVEPSGVALGIDVGLESFYTDSEGRKVANPRFEKKARKKLKLRHRRVSRKKKGSANRKKARNRLGRAYLKVSRQRKDFAIKAARCVVMSNDVIVFEDLQIANMVKNHCLARSISDVSWGQFRHWADYYGKVFGKIVLAVPPQYTSQDCSGCGTRVQKSLSERTHQCPKCELVLDRDENVALNILAKGLEFWATTTEGHSES